MLKGETQSFFKREAPLKANIYTPVSSSSDFYSFISTKWCCDKSTQDRMRMVVTTLWSCFPWTGKNWGGVGERCSQPWTSSRALRNCGASQRAQCRKAVEMCPFLTPSLTWSLLGGPQAAHPSPPLPETTPSLAKELRGLQ